MWTDLPKDALHAHNFSVHFSLPLDGHTHSTCVYHSRKYNSLFLLSLYLRVLRWSINGPIFPGQANSCKGITTWLPSETGHGFSYILWYVELKTTWIDAIKAYKIFWVETPTIFWLPTTPPLIPIGVLVVLSTLWNKLSKMVGILTSYVFIEELIHWTTISDYRFVENCTQAASCFLKIKWIEYFKLYF